MLTNIITAGPPNGPVLFCSLASVVVVCTSSSVRRSLSESVTLHGRSAGGFSRAGQAMTSCHLQSNYSSTVTLQGGPVRLSRHFVLGLIRLNGRLLALSFVCDLRQRVNFTDVSVQVQQSISDVRTTTFERNNL